MRAEGPLQLAGSAANASARGDASSLHRPFVGSHPWMAGSEEKYVHPSQTRTTKPCDPARMPARQQKTYFVYIMTNRSKTLYTGVANSLIRRVREHKLGIGSSFTAKYKLDRLVYFERFEDIRNAIEREKQIKGWLRIKKIALIVSVNPEWKDLSAEGLRRTSSSRRRPRNHVPSLIPCHPEARRLCGPKDLCTRLQRQERRRPWRRQQRAQVLRWESSAFAKDSAASG